MIVLIFHLSHALFVSPVRLSKALSAVPFSCGEACGATRAEN